MKTVRLGVWFILGLSIFSPPVDSRASDFNYTINADNTVTITNYVGIGGDVEIPEIIDGMQVTGLGPLAFVSNASLTSVMIPNCVTNLGGHVFGDCANLVDVKLPSGISRIPPGIFQNCTSLTSIIIPSSVRIILFLAFSGCTNLTSIYFWGDAPGVFISPSTLAGCSNAVAYHLPDAVWPDTWPIAPSSNSIPTALWTDVPAPVITGVSPDPITADADNLLQTLKIYGENFANKPTVVLTWTGQTCYTLPADRVTYINNSEVEIAIRLGREADNWTVKVVNFDGKTSGAYAFTAFAPVPGSHSPVVSNVRASQQVGKKLVDVWYDVSDQDSSTVAVNIEISDDEGLTYNIPVSSCSGNFGSSIVPGTNRHIVWDAEKDWNNHFSSTLCCKIIASDTIKSNSAKSTVTTVDTRTTAVTSLTITGPDSVIGGNTATYICTAFYADGSQADVSSLCTWSTVGTVPDGAQMYGPSLATASSFSLQTVQIRAAYQRPEGQIPSAPFTVTITAEDTMQAKLRNPRADGISPGNWEVSAEVSAFGRYGEVQCVWTLDGAVLPGATGTQLTRYPISGGVLGTRLLAAQVTDEQNQTATASQWVTFNKPIVPQETAIVPLVPDPENGKVVNSMGEDFVFRQDRKSVGLIILTHGLTGSAADTWITNLANSIEGRLADQEMPRPNVCIYGWPADPVGDISIFDNIGGLALAGEPQKLVANILAIHSPAIQQGEALAKWIKDEVAAGNIDPTSPIHLIGHSAGGFVMGECARLLESMGIVMGVVQVTSLDTPYVFPSDTKVFDRAKAAGSNVRLERYYDSWAGVGGVSPALIFITPAEGYYARNLLSGLLIPVKGHAWVHDWYDETARAPYGETQTGFYYSPFMDNGFHGITFTQPAQASDLAFDAPISLASEIPVSLAGEVAAPSLTDFETFGSVTLSNGLYRVTEEANAGLFKDIALPVGAQSVAFNYRFATAGDGDYLVVYWGTNGMPLYIGSDLQLAGTGFMEGEAPVSMFARETNQLTFMLVSRGETNAVLELKDITLSISDDPDYDGLTTDEEIALGSNPLNADTDGDGLSDFDEVRTYFTDPILTDSDGDGMSDFREINAGSDPNDPASCFAVSLTPLPIGGMRLTWQGKTGRHYRVNRCDQLGSGAYTTLATGVSGMEPQTQYDDTQGSSCAFYWVEQEP